MIGGQCMTNTNLCGIQWHKYGMHCHCVVSGQMLHCGKHREQRFVDVAKIDRPYCAWVLREGGPAFGPFSEYLRSQHGGVMSVGKYKSHFFHDIRRQDPEYCSWAMGLIDPGPALCEYIEYVGGSKPPHGHGEGENTPVRSKQGCAAGPCQCNICFSDVADHACIPCGHVLCGACAAKLRGGCPFCRAAIDRCMKLFLP